MKTVLAAVTLALMCPVACPVACFAQIGGGASNYGQSAPGSARAEQNERSKRAIPHEDMPPNGTSMFLEASVLMNVKADEYVAVFGITQEGNTLAECGEKMEAVLRQFLDALKPLGIAQKDFFVDFVVQNKIYAYEVNGTTAKEKVAGFELKKNVAIHFKETTLLDKLLAAAASAQVFDLIKVDYIVKDPTRIQNRLMEEAARIVKQKAARYERLFAIHLQSPAQLYAEKPSIYYPTEMYDAYTAFEAEDLNANDYRQKYVIQNARKSRTFFFNALNGKTFDTVVNPVVTEPIVQFTLYLKMKYAIAQSKAGTIGKTVIKAHRTGLK
jgi:uncharacterized protein YggE